MTLSINKLTSIFTMLVLTSMGAQANADEARHIDQMAVKIMSKSRVLMREVVHYRHTAEYGHLVADTKELYRLAKHIHDVTHFDGNLEHLASDLNDLDQKFHHLEGVFDKVEHNAAYGHGHVHGNTKHVKRTLNSIEGYIHHIQEDVDAIRRRTVVVTRPVYTAPVRYTAPIRPYNGYGHDFHGSRGHGGHSGHGYGGSGYGGSGFGFSIGGGSSRIQFRF